MNRLAIVALLTAMALGPSSVFGLSAEYAAPGTERLRSELQAQESRSQAPGGYTGLIARPELLGGYFVNSEDVFFFSGNKQAVEKFLEDYANLTNIVAHTVIVRFGVAPGGPPMERNKYRQYDWSVYCHPYGAVENQNYLSKERFVLWVELRVGGKIGYQDFYSLKFPSGVQVLPVGNDPPTASSEKEDTKP